MPTKVTILLNNIPLVGATVYVGEIGGNEKTSDDAGTVALPEVPSGFAGYTEVLIDHPSVFATAKIILRYNQTTTIDLGERVIA